VKGAVYAGSFDPPTNGHLWVIRKGAELFDWVTVVIAHNPKKEYFFEDWQRVNMFRDLKHKAKLDNVRVVSTDGLVGDYARTLGAEWFLRSYRNALDFQYESSLLEENRKYFPRMETVLLQAPAEYAHVSSSVVKARALHGQDLTGFVHPEVAALLKQRIKEKRDGSVVNRH
jgi:pantetheine-phosphate adenylyltransferase